MRWHFRKTWRPWPFRVSLTEKGPSWGVRVWRYGYDPKTGRHSFDTPGLGWVRSSGRRKSSKSAPATKRSPIWGLLGFVVIFVVATLVFGPSFWVWF